MQIIESLKQMVVDGKITEEVFQEIVQLLQPKEEKEEKDIASKLLNVDL